MAKKTIEVVWLLKKQLGHLDVYEIVLSHNGEEQIGQFFVDDCVPLDALKETLAKLVCDDWKQEMALRRLTLDQLKEKYDIFISKRADLEARQWNNEFKTLFSEFPGSAGREVTQ